MGADDRGDASDLPARSFGLWPLGPAAAGVSTTRRIRSAPQIIGVLDALSLSRVHWVGESSGGLIGLLLAAVHPEWVASLVLCNTPSRIPDRIRRIYALDRADAGAAMLAHGTGEWRRQTLGYRLDLEHANGALQDWVVREMDRTLPTVAAAMHHCFEGY